MTLLCGASTAVVGSALRYRAPQDVQVGNVLDDEVIGDIVGDAVDGMIDGAKTIISKIPLEEFGHLPAVTLEEAIADPSIIEEVLHNGTAGEVQTRDLMYERQSMLTNSSSSSSSTPFLNGTFTNVTITNTNTTTFTNTTTINTTNTTNTTTIETEATCDASTVSTRIEWRDYAPEDRKALVDSIACLLTTPSGGAQYAPSTNRYEDFVRTHQALVSVIHGNGLFLLWHRYFLAAFETALRTSCGFDRPLPWWDETLDNGAFNLSSLFTADYFGSLKGPVHGAGVCVTDGRFANLTCNIGPGQQNEAHCLSRAVNETLTVQASESFVEYCAVRTKFGDFSSCAETGSVFPPPSPPFFLFPSFLHMFDFETNCI